MMGSMLLCYYHDYYSCNNNIALVCVNVYLNLKLNRLCGNYLVVTPSNTNILITLHLKELIAIKLFTNFINFIKICNKIDKIYEFLKKHHPINYPILLITALCCD